MKQSRLWTVECGRSHATKITFTESEAISSMFAWKTIAMAEATIEYVAGEEYGRVVWTGMG